jgi:hypothetical protein
VGQGRLLVVSAIAIILGVMISVGMNSGPVESNVLILDVAAALAWAYGAFVAWKTASSLAYHPVWRAAWVVGVLIPFLNVLVLAALYDRCSRKIKAGPSTTNPL